MILSMFSISMYTYEGLSIANLIVRTFTCKNNNQLMLYMYLYIIKRSQVSL